MSGEAFDSVTVGEDATLSFDGGEPAHGSLAFKLNQGGVRLPRPDGPCWVGLRLPAALWDQVAGVLEAWKGEPFWMDRLPVSDAGWAAPVLGQGGTE